MDIFMDKLAQRTTAQEIIKANTAADVEELNKLRNQIGEYNECLAKLKRLIDDGAEKLSDMQTEEGEVGRLVKEGLDGLNVLRRTTESAGQYQKKIIEQLESLEQSVSRQLEDMSRTLEERIDSLNGLTEEQLAERLSTVEENVHKECVKVYRNVQAVVTEESGKQSESAGEVKTNITSFKGRLNAVLGFSVAAMLLSLAGVVVQILGRLGVLPF